MHPNEYRNGYWLSTKWALASDQSSAKSWLVQPIKKLSSAAGLCAGRGCALIRQLAIVTQTQYNANYHTLQEQYQSIIMYTAHTYIQSQKYLLTILSVNSTPHLAQTCQLLAISLSSASERFVRLFVEVVVDERRVMM